MPSIKELLASARQIDTGIATKAKEVTIAASKSLSAVEPPMSPVTVIQDDEEGFVVELEGIQFTPARNQVREDGTLTSGGFKAFESAKSELAGE
ncbi:hypothetical protein MO867_17195 [Microbulbifer sp. OS29]|uniref:Uncharacterized protein n=1 Tax=Microbulbifer okhotskensis TaxID=2926617 RepID=A0A9X2EQP1_9GAMM|nr:hypothetical protein [Microbulbifer okhotskensis]MCO1336069.1 hypothetical protein [Microbulbifer okhotskensis]